MMLAISVRINQYSAYQKQIKAWIESNPQSPSAMPCHHVILVESIAVAPTPGRESSRASF